MRGDRSVDGDDGVPDVGIRSGHGATDGGAEHPREQAMNGSGSALPAQQAFQVRRVLIVHQRNLRVGGPDAATLGDKVAGDHVVVGTVGHPGVYDGGVDTLDAGFGVGIVVVELDAQLGSRVVVHKVGLLARLFAGLARDGSHPHVGHVDDDVVNRVADRVVGVIGAVVGFKGLPKVIGIEYQVDLDLR